MNFIHLIERAISTQPEDHSVLKEFFNREYKKAERDHFYTKESFFNGLLEVLTRKKILIRKKFDNRKTDLEEFINKIDTYIVPYPQISDIPFDEINMDEYRKDKRNKLLKQSKDELKDITIYNYKNNIAPFAKVELIEKVINELFNKHEPEKQIKYTAKHHALAYLFDCDTNGRPRLVGLKKELEKIGEKRSKHKINGNTFYKAFNEIHNTDINIEQNIIKIVGANWRQAILNLSENPTLLNEYLKKKQL